MSTPLYEYRTTFALVPENFPHHERLAEHLSKISPKPPKGEDWQLVSSSSAVTMEGTVIFYFWERTYQGPSQYYPQNSSQGNHSHSTDSGYPSDDDEDDR